MSPRGRFLVLEGLDGSGGTTQVELLVAHLRASGLEVLRTSEPSAGPVGRLVRAALRGEEPLGDAVLPYLFAADRRDHLDREVLPALEAGRWVVSDRYAPSSLAYQSEALGLERVWELNRDFPLPDLLVYLELEPAACLERIRRRGGARERFEELGRLERVRAAYERALALYRERGVPVWVLDARRPAREVARELARRVDRWRAGG